MLCYTNHSSPYDCFCFCFFFVCLFCMSNKIIIYLFHFLFSWFFSNITLFISFSMIPSYIHTFWLIFIFIFLHSFFFLFFFYFLFFLLSFPPLLTPSISSLFLFFLCLLPQPLPSFFPQSKPPFLSSRSFFPGWFSEKNRVSRFHVCPLLQYIAI